jgi:hypothetical protein
MNPILLEEVYFYLLENRSLGNQLISQGKLSPTDFQKIIDLDFSPSKKYVGWIAKQWVLGSIKDIELLKNTLKKFESLSNRGKTKNKDIYTYKTWEELKQDIDYLQDSGQEISSSVLEGDFEVLKDDKNLLIISPHTHEASRKLGLSHFAFRDCKGGGKDSAWCTTYKAPNHFNDYYYKDNATLLYIKVRSDEILKKLKQSDYGSEYSVVALVLFPSETSHQEFKSIEGYNGLDKKFEGSLVHNYLKILNINFQPQYES